MRLVEKTERNCLQSLTEAKSCQAITKSALQASSASELLPLPVTHGICARIDAEMMRGKQGNLMQCKIVLQPVDDVRP